jgi:5-methylcytosine-specific restriction protein B
MDGSRVQVPRDEVAPREAYAAARQFVEVALEQDGSFFVPGTPIWATKVLTELSQRVTARIEANQEHFLEIMREQLYRASPAAIQLAAEVLFVHYLVPRDTKASRKRDHIERILGPHPGHIILPAALNPALQWEGYRGTVHGSRTPFMAFLVRFALRWKELDASIRAKTSKDPWAFKRRLVEARTFDDRAEPQRDALLHLLYPATFEPLLSEGHKEKIVHFFFGREGLQPPDDLDEALADLRTRLSSRYGQKFDYYNGAPWQAWTGKPE